MSERLEGVRRKTPPLIYPIRREERLRLPRRCHDSLSTDTERQMREFGEEIYESGVQMSHSLSGVGSTEIVQMREQMQLVQE